MQRAKEKIAEQADSKPRTEGFDPTNSISTYQDSTTTQVAVVDSDGAMAIAVGDSSLDTPREEIEDVDADASDAPPPSPTNAAATIPSDTIDMSIYELSADTTVDSSAVEEEEEEDSSSSASTYDIIGNDSSSDSNSNSIDSMRESFELIKEEKKNKNKIEPNESDFSAVTSATSSATMDDTEKRDPSSAHD
jgi:hypothetical protein